MSETAKGYVEETTITQMFFKSRWYWTILLIIEGVVIYGVSICILKDEFIYNILKKIINKFLKRNNNQEISKTHFEDKAVEILYNLSMEEKGKNKV